MVTRRLTMLLLSVCLLIGWGAAPAPAEEIDPRAILRALEEAFVAVADRAMPAVVNVSTVPKAGPVPRGPELEERFREFFGPEFFERFFPRRQPPRSRATGSGLVVDPSGYILTNNHVIENAAEITVQLSDKRKFTATLIGRDPKTDLAVLQIDAPRPIPVAELGDSDKIRIGEWAIAIGNPFGLDRTVTVGIISATGRTRVGVATYESFIQTDASINPGNSGGPLLNLDGQVIGINTAIVAAGQGIGFSIPINMAGAIMRQLIATGRVVRGWLGIAIQDLTEELASAFGVKPRSGVLVADVIEGSPAAAGGIKAGDIITEFGGAQVREATDLQKQVAATPPGQPTALTVIRDKHPRHLTVKVGEMPEEGTVVAAAEGDQDWGLTVTGLTSELAARHELTAKRGVVVTEVEVASAGDKAGIRPGDAILEINREPVADVEAFRTAIAKVKPGERVPVYLQRRGGRNQYVVLQSPS
ncbi:MAG: DegQ family serine endoprotease [Candidatus Methylomirabilia bacterium]